MSNLLNEKRALAKLRAELEGRKRRLCRCCRKFGHLARNYRNKKREEGTVVPQNKFEVLSSRVMQCGVEERIVRSVRAVVVKCFRCGVEGHKYRECPLGIRRKNGEKAARVVRPREAQQEERPVHPEKGKVQEKEKRLRRVEEGGATRVAKPREAQQGKWRRSSWEQLRKRAEWYCGPTVPQDAELWELGWHGVTPYKCLGKISDILHLNNENNQLERRAQPPKDVPLDAQSWTRAYHLSSRVVAVTTTTETS